MCIRDRAKIDDEAMAVKIPVGTIGIRGTHVVGQAAAEGENNSVTLLPNPGAAGEAPVIGAIILQTSGGTQFINVANGTVNVSSINQVPSAPVQLSASDLGQTYGGGVASLFRVDNFVIPEPLPPTAQQLQRQQQFAQESVQADEDAAEGEEEAVEDENVPEGEGLDFRGIEDQVEEETLDDVTEEATEGGEDREDAARKALEDLADEVTGEDGEGEDALEDLLEEDGRRVARAEEDEEDEDEEDEEDAEDEDDGELGIDDLITIDDGEDEVVSLDDVLVGDPGGVPTADTLSGGEGADVLIGQELDDTLLGGTGADLLVGGSGNDSLDGGDGIDSADYATDGGSGPVAVDLNGGLATDSFGGTDTLVNIEAVNGGSGDDNLIGNAQENILSGNAGNDTFVGGDAVGVDVITGGAGIDTLDYGAEGGTSGVTVDLAGLAQTDTHTDR